MAAIENSGSIREAITQLRNGNLFENSLRLFQTLGYNTSRRNRLSDNTFRGFKDQYMTDGVRFNEEKALVKNWQKIELLFQISNEEMQQAEPGFGNKKVDRNIPASYLFFALELRGNHHSRSQLANVAREINKLFPMHVFLLFKHGNTLSFALIDRRQNKREVDQDVLEKVTNLHNLSTDNPHSGHLQILNSLSIKALRQETPKKKLETFEDLQNGWRKVLSTQVLNKQFYLDYQTLSRSLIQDVHPRQVVGKTQAHQGVLNLLNRIMFIYFVQKKKWLMGDDNFLFHFWQSYNRGVRQGQPDTFHRDWLTPIFFYAFNGRAHQEADKFKKLPTNYRSEITRFPYLNGGLFTKSETLDCFELPDKAFDEIFAFVERYIFTITENTAYDLNLEVSPELLGRMYEGMINARDMNDLDAQKGIVYTEPAEINFMARRSFVEVLWRKKDLPEFERLKNLGREFLYHFVFDAIEQKKDWLRRTQADAETLRRAICSITACDPACGSGSMLLGVLQLQMELLKALDEFEGKPHSHKHDFEFKKQLISECLYGVDVKEWAVRIAELRLWLYMIEEAKFSQEELTQSPLLPNLDFKLRCGNSLLSRIGEQDFNLSALRSKKNLNSVAVATLTAFIEKKKQFIVNKAPESTFKKLKAEEGKVFKAFIKERIAEFEHDLKSSSKNVVQTSMFDVEEKDLFAASRAALAKEIDALEALSKDIERRESRQFSRESLLLSYELDFMEIFLTKDDPGFDLIIGNPPYVRQEDILPPDDGEYLEELLEVGSKEEKARVNKLQKIALNNKVFETYPFLGTPLRTLIDGKNKTVAVYGEKVPGRSDLYVYFQLLCPQYLNSNGIFCFIISNSWLDVEYGAFVQHFLLKHTRLLAVYDCIVRSFNASVNTVIYLHSAPINTKKPSSYYKTLEPPEQPVRFVMNRIDYSMATDAGWLIEQEQAEHNTFRTNYRIIMQSQKSLYCAGYNEETKSYEGDKWGSKYLRAPEIYYTILEKGKDKLVRLGDIAEVRRGFTTGANEFFYLDEETIAGWGVEKEFLVPVLKSPKECQTIEINPKALKSKLFYCHKDRKDLKGTNALRYIKWGEESELDENGKEMRAFHLRPSCRGRKNWYDIGIRDSARLNCNYMIDSLMRFYLGKIFVGDNFQEIHFQNNEIKEFIFSANSSLFYLFLNVVGRANFGDGLMKLQTFEVADLIMMRPTAFAITKSKLNVLESFVNRPIKNIYQEFCFDRDLPIRNQQPNPLSDRKALDDIIFDELGLTPAERNEVYWSVAELVKQRLDKAATR